MTNPYNTQVMPQNGYDSYQPIQPQPRQSGGFGALTSIGTGALAGGVYGHFKYKNPLKHGEASDSFVRKALQAYAKNGGQDEQAVLFSKKKSVLEKLKGVKTAEQFANVVNNNSIIAEKFGDGVIPTDTGLESLKKGNLKKTLKALREKIQKSIELDMQNMKNSISTCWDAEKKKFSKDALADETMYKSIKNTHNKILTNKTLKYAGIGALVAAGLSIAGKLFYNSRMAAYQQAQAMQADPMIQQQMMAQQQMAGMPNQVA